MFEYQGGLMIRLLRVFARARIRNNYPFKKRGLMSLVIEDFALHYSHIDLAIADVLRLDLG